MNVYIHIPFCKHKCSYCHFYSTTCIGDIDSYISALTLDIDINLPRAEIETIYFGGGTPSLLTTSQLKQIIEVIISKSRSKPQEITLEANPESLVTYYPEELLQTGINRLSVGIQSWQLEILSSMGRSFNPSKLIKYIREIQSNGLKNINFDHIIAYPGQSQEMIQKDIEQSLSLDPTHISVYPLEIHDKTLLHQQVEDGRVIAWSDKDIVKAFSVAQIVIQRHGYRHYEELNFAKPGYECLHNLHFWQGKNYLGFGPGAVSRVGSTITENLPNVANYINAIQDRKCSESKITILTSQQLKLLISDLQSRLV